MTDEEFTQAHADNAATALDAFERRVFQSTEPLHRSSPFVANEMVRGLLTDLLHYAASKGLNFDAAVQEARQTYGLGGEPSLETTQFPIGNQVQWTYDLPDPVTFRGVVVEAVTTGWGQDHCVIYVPGMTEMTVIPADRLTTAEPFHSVLTERSPIPTTPYAAEEALVDAASRVELARRHGRDPDPRDVSDQERLSHAVGTWAGTGAPAVLKTLQAVIVEVTDGREIPGVMRLAAESFPIPLTDCPAGPADVIADDGPAHKPGQIDGPRHPGR